MPSSRQPLVPGPRREVLDNGLVVYLQEVTTTPLVSVWCWYRVGSRDEGPGMTGASHWVEHMNFKGTKNISRDQMTGLIERYGGSWNGYTWLDQTTYFETADRGALEQMLFVEAERMSNCLYDRADCESERTVIISELQGGENDPEELLDIEVTATALKAHPYRHPTIGWLGDLRTMQRDDLYEHYRRFYVPCNATLVVVGQIEADAALRRVARHFGGLDPGSVPPRPSVIEPPARGEKRVTITRPGTTAYLKVAFQAPAVADPDFVPMLLLDAALTGAKGVNLWASFREPPPQRSSRLYRRLVDRGLASEMSGALLPTREPFLYVLSATAIQGVALGALERVLADEIEAVRIEGLGAPELARAKRQLRARIVFETESVTNMAHQLGFFETVDGVAFCGDLEARVGAATVDDLKRVAARYLTRDGSTVGWLVPEPNGTTQPVA